MAQKPVRALSTQEFINKYGINAFTSEAVRRGLKMDSEISRAHELKAEEINAIKQTNSKGFRIIDIDPNQLTRSEYFCVYPQNVLDTLVGQDYALELGVRIDNTGVSTGTSTVDAYWRTVNIPIAGNFLKIEYLPSRSYDAGNLGVASIITPDGVQTNTIPQNTNDPELAAAAAAKRVMLLDFETPTNSPIIVKSGDVYKTYFTQVFLTLKQMNCKIRITIGSNSEIETSYEAPKNLSMWDGGGFTRENMMHPTPFCYTDSQFTAYGYGGTPIDSTTFVAGIIFNELAFASLGSTTRTVNRGVSVNFLTGFTGLGYIRVAGDFVSVTSYELFIAEFNEATLAITTLKKRIAAFNCSTSVIAAVNGSGWYGAENGVNFNEPIRVSLNGGECLAIRLIPVYRNVAHTVYCKFQITGYVMGPLQPLGSLMEPAIRFKEHPFPYDVANENFPRL